MRTTPTIATFEIRLTILTVFLDREILKRAFNGAQTDEEYILRCAMRTGTNRKIVAWKRPWLQELNAVCCACGLVIDVPVKQNIQLHWKG
jgi:hypothetical protein